MIKSARLSPCGRFRRTLERVWGQGGRLVLFVMLNPSIADDMIDDPTAIRAMTFAKAWGYDGIRIVNLCSYRATAPQDMYDFIIIEQTAAEQQQDATIISLECARPDIALVICAWGKVEKPLREHAAYCWRRMHEKRSTYALKINKDGTPSHPLYLPSALRPIPYSMEI